MSPELMGPSTVPYLRGEHDARRLDLVVYSVKNPFAKNVETKGTIITLSKSVNTYITKILPIN